ncbi:MAG: polysaccharide biosynthesis C-terminal domain-containing protein, partial [Clostridia bacterium]|nr:polysaccharide biosynthesis C-terminal domain-containing protein [Clostridia bacterium]
WGKKQPDAVKKLSAIGLWCNFAITLFLFLLVSLFPTGALRLFTGDAEIITQGVAYLNIMRFSYMCFGFTAVMLGTMRIAETVKIALQVSVLSLIINVSINFLLIPGRFGLPELGVRGAAIGTLTARVVEFLLVAHYLFHREKKLRMKPRDCLHLDRQMFADYLRVSLPVIFASILWGVSNAVQTMILGHMDRSAIAAQSISATLFALLKVTSIGAASAASIIIGKTIGAGEMNKVKEYTRTLQILFVMNGVVLALLYTVFRFPLLSLYRISPETRAMATVFMNIQTVVLFTMSYQMPVNAGIIRGGGDTRYMMHLDIISQLIMYPLALVGAFLLHWSPVVIMFIVNSDQIFKCIPAFIRVNSYKWVRALTRS